MVMFDLDQIPRRYVPGRGPIPCPILFVGEAPGQTENATGWPFVGQAGEELERYLWWGAKLDRTEVHITNLYKFWPLHDARGKQLAPNAEQIRNGEPELLMELDIIRPRIVVAVGAHASRWFLGSGFKSMRRDGGIPRTITLGGREITILPVTHPAAGLHSDREQVFIQDHFKQLGRLLRGEIEPRPPVDEYPNPKYARITDASGGADQVLSILAGQTVIAIDTEGSIADPWCVTFSVRPGEAWLIRADQPESLAALDRHINAPHAAMTVITHYEAHDIPVAEAMGVRLAHKHLAVGDGQLTNRDTMSEAYLLGTEPKGLKPLSWRLAGMSMTSYEELVGPTEQLIARGYIKRAFGTLGCRTCGGLGKVGRASTKMVADPNCPICNGLGKVAIGKQGQALKHPKGCQCRTPQPVMLKSLDTCSAGCVDGMLVPLPDKEFVFDSSASSWRWKQPQSIAKWIRRRLANAYIPGDAETVEGDDPTAESGSVGDSNGGDQPVDAQSEINTDAEPAANYFHLRRDWNDLGRRADKTYVEVLLQRMPPTTLSDVPDQDAVTRYATGDSDGTLRIAPKLEARLAAIGLLPVREMDAAFVPMLSRMEQIGLHVDRPHFERLRDHLDGRMDEIRDRLASLVGEKMNPNSERLADVLFKQLGLPTIKLTKSGERESIDDEVLGALKAKLRKRPADDGVAQLGLAIMDCVTDYREVLKIANGYVDPILEHSDSRDHIHTTLNYTATATGRLSSSEPINLQTLPNPDNFPPDTPPERNYGLQVRGGINAGEGYLFVGVDYSQIEMVVGAHLSQDPGMLNVFRSGLDLHYYAASMMFDIPYDQVSKQLRTQTKPLNFGVWYEMGAMGLQSAFASLPGGAVEKSEAECQDLINRYYRAFPGVLSWKQQLWERGERDGFVRDMFGRIRWTPGLRSNIKKVRRAAEREACNMPIQCSANGIIRIASRQLWERTLPMIWAQSIDAQPAMQTHDENVLRVERDHALLVGEMVAGTMRNAVRLSVPIKAEAKIGWTLYDIK